MMYKDKKQNKDAISKSNVARNWDWERSTIDWVKAKGQ